MSMLTRWTGNRDFPMMSDFRDIRRQMDQLFNEMFTHLPAELDQGISPKISVDDDGSQVVVRAEIPGFSEKDIKVSILDGMLTISGERKAETREKKNGDSTEKTETYQFVRKMSLPGKIDPDKSAAEIKNGLLTVTLNRTAESRARQIDVKGS